MLVNVSVFVSGDIPYMQSFLGAVGFFWRMWIRKNPFG